MTGREWLAEALRTEINGRRGPFKTQDMELHVHQPKRRVNGLLNLVSASGEVRDPATVQWSMHGIHTRMYSYSYSKA